MREVGDSAPGGLSSLYERQAFSGAIESFFVRFTMAMHIVDSSNHYLRVMERQKRVIGGRSRGIGGRGSDAGMDESWDFGELEIGVAGQIEFSVAYSFNGHGSFHLPPYSSPSPLY